MSSVKIVIRKDKLNKNGTHPIHFRIISNRKIKYIASSISVKIEQWNEEESKVTKIQNSARINAYLTTKFGELQNSVLEVETNSKSVTQKILKEKIYGKSPLNFFEFTEKLIEQYKASGQIALMDKYSVLLEKLKKHTQSKDLNFQDITLNFLENYEVFLRTKLKNKVNTIKNDMRFIRTLFNIAITQDKIEPTCNPFHKYKIRSEKTQRLYLTEDELLKIEQLILPEMSVMNVHRDLFIFQCYGGGLRISDVLSLQWKQFDGTHIHIFTQKTKESISISLPKKALEIVRKYEKIKNDYLEKHPDEIMPFIFPIYHSNLDLNDVFAIDLSLSRATAMINKKT